VQALNVGDTLTDSFTVTTVDGTQQQVTITINGRNDAAVISGTSTGSVIEAGGVANATAGTPTASGTLTDTDVDNAANTFTAVGKDSLGRQDSQSITVNLPSTVTHTYDLNGNLTYDGNRAFDYDDENQLIRVTVTNNWKSEFTYDGTMRRRIRKEFLWQNGGWAVSNEVHYVYDGKVVIQERNGSNVPTVTYARGRDLDGGFQRVGGTGGLLSRTDQSTITPQHAFYHADANGNLTMLINNLQLNVAKYSYDLFGNIVSKSGPLADFNLYRFSSKEAIVAPSVLNGRRRYTTVPIPARINITAAALIQRKDLRCCIGITSAASAPANPTPISTFRKFSSTEG